MRADVAAPAGEGADLVRVTDERGRVIASAMWAPEPAPIALRVYARGGELAPLDLERRLARAIARRGGETVCRLVHAEADRLPGLFVDRWGEAAVVQAGTAAMDRREAEIA